VSDGTLVSVIAELSVAARSSPPSGCAGLRCSAFVSCHRSWPKALELLEKQIDMGIAIDALAISCKVRPPPPPPLLGFDYP
jgi:hypothetical protein